MNKTLNAKLVYISITLFFFLSTFAIAQKKGTKKAEFFPEKVIVTDINEKGEAKKREIEAPKGYTAIRGDIFTDAFAYSRFDKSGEKTQTLAVVNLSYKALHHYVVTYIGKETIQLPDQTFATANHFTVSVKETSDPGDKNDIWIDDRGFLVLYTFISPKKGTWEGAGIIYQKSYDKNKSSGSTCDIFNGQYMGSNEWEVIDFGKESFTLKMKSFFTKKMGGFTMFVEYSLDKDFNPQSYSESWHIPTK